MLIAYWICFLVGTVYALISALLGGFFGAMGEVVDIDIGDVDGFDGDGAGDAGIAPLSPATIAVFLSTFGGTGIILTSLLNQKIQVSLPISALAGFALAGTIFFIFYKIFTAVQGSSESRVADLIGLKAEVITPIPADGAGEIAYVSRANRLSSSARSQDGGEIPRHIGVRIVRLVGNTAYVTPLTEEERQGPPPKEFDDTFKE